MADASKTKVKTSEFRVSFPTVFTPKSDKYSLTLLFPKKDSLTGKKLEDYERCIKEMKAAALAAAVDKFGSDMEKPEERKKIRLKMPFKDAGDFTYDGYEAGMVFVRTSSKTKPGLLDRNAKPIVDESEFYPGCWAWATINAYAYDFTDQETKMRSRGVSFGLMNIQKLRDDAPFGNRTNPEDDFSPIAGEEDGGSSDSAFDDEDALA
jgi:hypothetical protein